MSNWKYAGIALVLILIGQASAKDLNIQERNDKFFLDLKKSQSEATYQACMNDYQIHMAPRLRPSPEEQEEFCSRAAGGRQFTCVQHSDSTQCDED
jgi:hypothetical protein